MRERGGRYNNRRNGVPIEQAGGRWCFWNEAKAAKAAVLHARDMHAHWHTRHARTRHTRTRHARTARHTHAKHKGGTGGRRPAKESTGRVLVLGLRAATATVFGKGEENQQANATCEATRQAPRSRSKRRNQRRTPASRDTERPGIRGQMNTSGHPAQPTQTNEKREQEGERTGAGI